MPESLQEKYKKSPTGLLYIAPTGSGKTLQALKATLGENTTAVGTSSLTRNFEQEETKHFGTRSQRAVDTYAGLARTHSLPGGKNLIIDESHNIRNPQTKSFRKLLQERDKYDKTLLLTATPLINEPYDITSQINLVAKNQVLPVDKAKFYSILYNEQRINPGIIAKLRGVEDPVVRTLKNPEKLRKHLEPYVYIEDPDKVKSLIPKRKEELVHVPMSQAQQEIYQRIKKKVPYSVSYKIDKNLPPSKSESRNLNAYLVGLRQVSNTTKPFSSTIHENPKIQKIYEDISKELHNKGKVLVYSNFLEAGVEDLKSILKSKRIPSGEITGSLSKAERQRQVDDYNQNKTRVLLFTGAGSEGLNLPKTTAIYLTEPHWNSARLLQASSRGIRRGDDPNRTIPVKTYLSVFPEKQVKFLGIPLWTKKPERSVDQYLYDLSKLKERENTMFINSLTNKNHAI